MSGIARHFGATAGFQGKIRGVFPSWHQCCYPRDLRDFHYDREAKPTSHCPNHTV